MNFWDKLMATDEGAASYMESYGEGPGSETRHTLGKFINDRESVLDVGCGPGHNLQHFVEHGPAISNYHGHDYSSRFVRAANNRWRSKIPPRFVNIQWPYFSLGDVRQIPQPDESWDVVIMQDVLEHTNGYKKPLKEALRVAKKRVIVTFWHLMDKEEDNAINDDGDDGWGAWYSRPKWEKYLDSLELHWLHDQIVDNKPRDYYIIDKVTNGDGSIKR